MANLPKEAETERDAAYMELCNKFAPKSVIMKCAELVERGYLVVPPGLTRSFSQSWLTDKGRHALETSMTSG
jgi:hypothetical protein